MTTWKLVRQLFGKEEFLLPEGEDVSVGRGVNNNITLASIVVSRNHCVVNVQDEIVVIKDLQSSNGVYVGTKKIPQNTPYLLKESDVIGFGWTVGAPVANINDDEKYIFKLVKKTQNSTSSRIRFQSENEEDSLEAEIAALEQSQIKQERIQSPILENKVNLKRKLDVENDGLKDKMPEIKRNVPNFTHNDGIINISDSDNESVNINNKVYERNKTKIPKTEPVCDDDESFKPNIKIEIKPENDEIEYEAFKVKQEYYDDEPIEIDSDNESEDDQWAIRLSQSSPGKPFIKTKQPKRSSNLHLEDNSYSQLDDFLEEEDILDDLIVIPPQPPDGESLESNINHIDNNFNEQPKSPTISQSVNNINNKELVNSESNKVSENEGLRNESGNLKTTESICQDQVDGISPDLKSRETHNNTNIAEVTEEIRKVKMIDPLEQINKKRATNNNSFYKVDSKSKTISKSAKDKNHSSSKRRISDSQKEERKKKLKEIAAKEKQDLEKNNKSSSCSSKQDKTVVNAKVTVSNRGAFLSDTTQDVKKLTKNKESLQKSTKIKKSNDSIASPKNSTIHQESKDDIENKKKNTEKSTTHHKSKHKHKDRDSKHKNTSSKKPETTTSSGGESRIPLKSLKPLSESKESFSGKPFSKVEPLPHQPLSKPKKKVSFSEQSPEVYYFLIEEGNNLKKTSLIKTRLLDVQNKPVFSLEKMTLMKILRWNPYWLEEQMKIEEPPPILGHSNTPTTIFHSFRTHSQYVEQVGDLLLMEIWECLTQGYVRLRGQNVSMEMRVETLPPVPAQERYYELFNLSVNMSLPNSELKKVPRMGEIMIIDFGPPEAKNRRFFFVHNVRCLPSPPNNIRSFFSISLHSCYTEKMKLLRPGEVMMGYSLAHINKELMLFDAMEYLAGSPLSEAILRPEPRHFVTCESSPQNENSEWTKTLNPSQRIAVNSSVAAALGDRPSIQMVQGPPGTGKSSVICAIVMSYFYDSSGKKQQNRGKILICATSNAAVDELVIRLLNIRQNLPKVERFRMVRVGRAEAMHPRAHEVSSQELAQRDALARLNTEPAHPAVNEEILHLEAKINMWKTQAQDAQAAKKSERVAYCQTRVNQLLSRIALVRRNGGGGGGGGTLGGEQLAHAERRIIEGADIVVTTLASAHNAKMRALKRRIALCIVDEAGQAIEPETLIPLTLDVTRLTLIGDPQQLPGFICSQRAKKHGLGESLFSRLSSCAEQWSGNGGALLLRRQYRMHPHIADFPNRAFYGGQVDSCAPKRPDLGLPPYALIAICSGDKGQVMGANELEALAVSRIAAVLFDLLRGRGLSLAVVTPYTAHRDLLRHHLRRMNDSAYAHVEVNTVDSFQGQERDVVIVSLARSHGVGFLTDAGRMNVMLTRARHALLVCLNPYAVLKNQLWRSLVEDAQRRELYRELPNRMCQPLSTQISAEEVFSYINNNKKDHLT